MAIVRKTITLTHKQDDWVKTQVRNGSFTNESEYIRDLVRRDQNQNAEFLATKEAIEYVFKSGISEMNVPEIMKEVEDNMRKDEEQNREFLMTKIAIQEGLDSGISAKTRTSEEIFESAKKQSLAKSIGT